MDSDTRTKVRRARDSFARRSMGLNSASHTSHEPASRSRRWTDSEIEAAVLRIGGGKKISRHAYKLARRLEDPNLSPSHNTVFARRPDLFSST